MNDTTNNRTKIAKQIRKYAQSYKLKTLVAEYSVTELQAILERVQANYTAKANREAMGIA